MRRRFFVERFAGGRAELRGQAAHHLGRVLRAEPGQRYELSDGQQVWLARVVRAGRDAVEFALEEAIAAREPDLRVALLLSVVKFDRFEWALEKATELGVESVVPLFAARSDRGLLAAAGKRARRWQRILLESAQQARRLAPPVLAAGVTSAQAFAAAQKSTEAELRIILSERAEAAALRRVLDEARAGDGCKAQTAGTGAAGAVTKLALAIGPEGGWTDDEFAAARAAGFREASLGANILRAETAVVAALAALHFALGE
jgi:16S rRNA (uracil1498-N3)-methyltransferase